MSLQGPTTGPNDRNAKTLRSEGITSGRKLSCGTKANVGGGSGDGGVRSSTSK